MAENALGHPLLTLTCTNPLAVLVSRERRGAPGVKFMDPDMNVAPTFQWLLG